MEPGKQKSSFELKECVVQLERIEMATYDADSSDSDDLPVLPFPFSSTRKKIKSKKSSAELLKEHQNLAQDIKGNEKSGINIEETIRRLETVEIVATEDKSEDKSSETPDPAPPEENDIKIFNVRDSLQFFNSYDVTPDQCGYKDRCHGSFPVHIFEQKMLSFKRVEFEHVISSFLYAAKDSCISDLKSFITFLLRTLSIHNDTTCVNACYRVLVSLLNKHPDASCLTFSSAEIFMLLFNHGVDIDSFKFLSKWANIKKNLEVPQYQKKGSSGIPSDWLFNLKYMLKAIIEIISSCTFKEKDIEKIIFFFLWMSKDALLVKENLYPIVQKCINVCLENIKEQNWNKTLCNIINGIMSMEELSVDAKWTNIYRLTKSFPIRGLRAIELRKQISFFSLKCLCLGSTQNIDEECLNFNIDDLKSLLKQLIEIDRNLLKYASKFIDGCTKNLGASKEEYNELCNLLKKCEACLIDQNEQTHFCKIYSKLRTFCGRKVSFHERYSMHNLIAVKSEYDSNQEFSENDSEVIDKNRNSFIPYFSEASQSCSTKQSDHANLFPNINCNNVQIKSEYTDEVCAPENAQKPSSVKILIRKKRSSRSSSGNGLVDPNLPNNDSSNDEDTSRQSPEFECQLLNDDLSSKRADVQNSTVDLSLPGADIVISDFSVEYPEETCNSVKTEPEQYFDQKMDIVDNENCVSLIDKLPSTSQNLAIEDLSPLPEICEVKSIAQSNMDDMENSTLSTPALHCETTSIINNNLDAIENPSLTSDLDFTSSPSTHKDTLLDADEDILFIQETISPKKFSKIDKTEENIPSPIQRYSRALPELSITPVKSVPSSSVACSSSLTDNEDIIIIEEKTPVKDNDDVILLEKILSPSKTKSNISSKTKLQSNIAPESVKTQVSNKIATELNILPEIEISKICIESQENNSDSDDIAIVDVIIKDIETNTYNENKFSKSMDNSVDHEPVVKISHLDSECSTDQSQKQLNSVLSQNDVKKNTFDSQYNVPDLQCQEALDSVLKQIDVEKNTFDSQGNTPNLQCQETLNIILKQIDVMKSTFDSQCNEVSEVDANDSTEVHSRSFIESSIVRDGFISESDLTKQTPESKIIVSRNTSSPSSSDKSNLSDLDSNNNIENQNVNILALRIPEINVENCTSVSKKPHPSVTNKTQNIISDSFVQSISEKSDSNMLGNHENQKSNALTIIIPNNKSENCAVPQVNLSDKSVLECNKNNRISGNCTQNLTKTFKNNICNQNKINPNCHTKTVLDTLMKESKSSAKKTILKRKEIDLSMNGVAKKSFRNEHGLNVIKFPSEKAVIKNSSSYISPSSRIQRKRSWSNQCENSGDIANRARKSPKKYSPIKSSLIEKYSSYKSPKKLCNYSHWTQKYKHLNRTAYLSKLGRNLPGVLRGHMASSSSYNPVNIIHDDDSNDSDIIELYIDPKRYVDKDCLVVYESENIVIIDSD